MSLKIGKFGWFALKLDLETAYNRMEWSFLRSCLQALEVDQPSIKMILQCVASASSTILVNGKKSEPFNHSRGLRQHDPISRCLFNICIQGLSDLIHKSCMAKEWVPFGVGRNKIQISHLLFADDLVLFGRVDEVTAFAMRDILAKFGEMSGQKVNEDKSRLIFSPNTNIEMRELAFSKHLEYSGME